VDLDRVVPWWLRRHLVALALVAVAAALRVWPLQALGPKLAWLTFYPVVMLAAIYGGLSAGLLATACACLIAAFGGPLLVGQTFIAAPADWLGVVVFVMTGSMISGVAEAMRRANARARRAQEQAEAANHAKSAFLANMSHELRTPLNAILGFSGILRTDPAIPEEQRRTLDIINRSGEHLLTLINDVLDMAKVEAGGLVAQHEVFDLGQTVLDVLDMMRARADEQGIQLLLDQSSTFPRVVRGDTAKLRQVLVNLIGNAIRHTEVGDVSVRLSARYPDGPERPLLTIDVEDTGVGIAEKDQEVIFDPFVQIDDGTVRTGTGLGLAITREYVGLMGGTITVESRPGVGSVFRVVLPVEKAEESGLYVAGTDPGRVTGLSAGQVVPRVLIVEDQMENWLLLQRLLEDAGVTVSIAEDGREGVDAFREWHPDLIFMDIRMPRMDGLEATRAIRDSEGGADVRIVALTASVFREERDEILAAGMDDFLRKPYRAREVFDCLERELEVVFEHESPVSAPGALPYLGPGAFAAMPKELRVELADALVSLDAVRIGQAAGRIGAHDPALGATVTSLVDGLAYTTIMRALQEGSEG
jgi:signal transduction histidine kinase/ActR/RegA family two-component response regulator